MRGSGIDIFLLTVLMDVLPLQRACYTISCFVLAYASARFVGQRNSHEPDYILPQIGTECVEYIEEKEHNGFVE